MAKFEKYNMTITEKWSSSASKNNSQLLFALAANEQGDVFAFWDNERGNVPMLDYLKQMVKMLEQNPNSNFGGN